jgi:hypothetical protein
MEGHVMSCKHWIVVAVLVIVNSPIFAKPADLPVDQRINTAAPPAVQCPATPTADCPRCPCDEARAVEAFRRAETHRENGRMADARRGYQETHLLAPTSIVGQRAIERLREIDNSGNDFFEEQEPPLSRTSLRPVNDAPRPLNQPKPTREQYEDMLRQTQPLGGVRLPREVY